jgi:hypothetical protein
MAAITVFNGRDNEIKIALINDGVPISAEFVGGVCVNVYDRKHGSLLRFVEGRANQPNFQSVFDVGQSELVPGGGDVPIRIISMALGLVQPRLPVGQYLWAELILFSPNKPHGVSWAQFALAVYIESPVIV